MKIRIQRVDKELPLPAYATGGAVAFDVVTRVTTVVEPGGIALVPGNVIVGIPEGTMLLVAPRSSMPRKKGLTFPHGVGLIDQDYCGPEDELLIQVQNITKEPVTVERGERIAQAVFIRIEKAEWEEVEGHGTETRGGFGTTGTH
jgi:dUTP pyrophosphatase